MQLTSDQKLRVIGHLSMSLDALRALQEMSIRSRAELEDRTIKDSVLMKLQVIGEGIIKVQRVVAPDKGAGQTPVEPWIDSVHPAEFWRNARGLRNVISHGYVAIDLDIIWNMIANDLDAFELAISRVIAEIRQSQ